jgi:uncharacterized protein YjiS (DUF1127 family)
MEMPNLRLAKEIHEVERSEADLRRAFASLSGRWAYTLRVWRGRARQRKALKRLDDRLLDDVGLSREQARRETAKPFWRR